MVQYDLIGVLRSATIESFIWIMEKINTKQKVIKVSK